MARGFFDINSFLSLHFTADFNYCMFFGGDGGGFKQEFEFFNSKHVNCLFRWIDIDYFFVFQGGIYVLTLIDEYAAGFATMVNGVFMCIAIGWVYGVRQFCTDIKHMIGHSVGYWWKAMWKVFSPIIITVSWSFLYQSFHQSGYPNEGNQSIDFFGIQIVYIRRKKLFSFVVRILCLHKFAQFLANYCYTDTEKKN